jgi:cytochrome P450
VTSEFDALLTSPNFYADPYPAYHRLRAEAPVYWSEALGAWLFTRYADVVSILQRPSQFLNSGRVTYLLEQLPADARGQVAGLEAHYRVGVGHTDPPDHTRLRALLTRAFTPRIVETQRASVAAVVNELLDPVADTGEMDVIRDLAYPLPATIIAGMIGAPAEDRAKFREWAMDINALFSGGGRVDEAKALDAQRTQIEMRDYILALAGERRKCPQDDLISALVTAQDDGDKSQRKLTEAELVSTCVTLFVAGHETTTNLIGNGILTLLRNPIEMQKLKDDPSLITGAVEEILRYESSVARAWRLAAEDIKWAGHLIRKGQMVLGSINAANRDPARFPDPDRFDICRADNKHVAFGYGIHFCLGAPLARLEAPFAINAMLRRFPELQLATDAPEWMPDIALRGLKSLPVTF